MRSAVLMMTMMASLVAVEVPAQLVDRSIRYINGRVVTLGDLVDYLQSNRPKQPSTTVDEEIRMWRDALERVTDDTLLRLFAEEKEVQIDPALLGKRILLDLKARGQLATPDAIARWRRELMKREMSRAALAFFDMRSANITPQELTAAYAERKDAMVRPARAHILQFVLRASDGDERTAVNEANAALFRTAQGLPGPLAETATRFLPELLEVADDEARRQAKLDEVVAALAALADEGLDRDARAARDEAKALLARIGGLRSREAVETDMAEIRARLAAGDAETFRAEVRARSEGSRRDEGGDLEWVERGRFHPDFDRAAFETTPPGAVSDFFWVGDACCLLWVVAREETRQRPFAEVCGELEVQLREERYDEIYARTAGILRARATIRDLVDIAELVTR